MALEEIRRQIDSINKTSQITKAMSLVSTTKYNRIVNISSNYEIYATKIKQTVANLMRQVGDISNAGYVTNSDLTSIVDFHDLLINRPVKKSGYLVITSDKGLAGGYNSTILKEFKALLDERNQGAEDIVVMAVGEPIMKLCRKENFNVAHELHHLSDFPTFTQVQSLIQKCVELFKNETFDELYLVYNHSINALQNEFRCEQLLPLTNLPTEEKTDVDYAIEPDVPDVLDILLSQYAESMIYGTILDAKTAEQASRMQAMTQATDNATDLIKNLQYVYNQQRQKRVTNEIIEITSGANAQN
ncbi:MAG: ATP synthase F1 subunit gamma [Ruoffia tabacinasalis]|uniref:ATP synthase F1 subunit gamma n=1 Tax=unclassified Ruoffia TaxID=2862149 RepID=UPI000EBC9F6A|nr:ATP synthase F1 subunit gamma [Aerococcaceae bacterium]